MKSKIKYTYQIYKKTVNTTNFILLFCLSIVGSFFGVFGCALGDIYLEGFFSIFWNENYVSFVLLLLLLNMINVYTIFNENDYFIIRIKNKKEYINQLLWVTCLSSFVLVLTNIMLVIIFLNLFNSNAPLYEVKNYHMNPWIYAVFVLIKFIILTQLITVINVLLIKLIDKKIVIIVNIILLFLIRLIPSSNGVISSVVNMPLSIFDYFGQVKYISFIFEILCFVLYCVIILCVVQVLKKVYFNMKKGVLE